MRCLGLLLPDALEAALLVGSSLFVLAGFLLASRRLARLILGPRAVATANRSDLARARRRREGRP